MVKIYGVISNIREPLTNRHKRFSYHFVNNSYYDQMKRRAHYTNFILSTPKIFLQCYVSREEAKEVWEK